MRVGDTDDGLFDCAKRDKRQNCVKLQVGNAKNVCVSILGFLIPERTITEYHGSIAKILCQRVPETVYGSEMPYLELPLSVLDVKRKKTVQPKDLKELENRSARSIDVAVMYNTGLYSTGASAKDIEIFRGTSCYVFCSSTG